MIDAEDIKELIDTSDRLVASVSTDFHRYLSSEIGWIGLGNKIPLWLFGFRY